MTSVIADISVSLDGFVAGPASGADQGLGSLGEQLHSWAFSDDADDRRVLRESTERSGAVLLGRTLFDIVDAPGGWNDELGYGAREVGKPPFFVVTSRPPDSVRLVDLDWSFVTTGLEDAVAAARDRAGERDVVLMGGGQLVRTAIAAGLVDTLVLHLSPVLLGGGTPLFEHEPPRSLVQRSVVTTSTAVHLTYGLEPREP